MCVESTVAGLMNRTPRMLYVDSPDVYIVRRTGARMTMWSCPRSTGNTTTHAMRGVTLPVGITDQRDLFSCKITCILLVVMKQMCLKYSNS